MKTKLLILSLFLIGGCETFQTPEQRLYNSKLTFLGTIKTINVLKEAGRFDEKDIEQIRSFANSGHEILKQWEDDGGMTPDLLDAFETILSELAKYKLKGVDNE